MNKLPLLIGIGTKKGSGKDTLAQFMYSAIKEHCVIIHFADALKQEVAEACQVPIQCIEENKPVFRPILQWWGTEFKRRFFKDDNYWIEALHRKFLLYRVKPKIAIIPDVRFPNEFNFVKENNGILIKVCREQSYKDNHDSETALDNYTGWDHVIDNNGNLFELEDKARLLASIATETARQSSPD
jgi:hypothetical protein